jgi:hypothetical protein
LEAVMLACGHAAVRHNRANGKRRSLVESGPLVIGHTDKAAHRSCPTSLLRNVGSSYPEELALGDFVAWQSLSSE